MNESESTWARTSKGTLSTHVPKISAAYYVPHPKNLRRKFLSHCTNPRNSWNFSPSKVSHYMVVLQSWFAKFSWKTVLVKSWRVWLIAVVLLNSLFAVCFPYNSVLGKHTHYRVSAQAPHFKGSASIQMYAIFIPGKHPCELKSCYVPMGVYRGCCSIPYLI